MRNLTASVIFSSLLAVFVFSTFADAEVMIKQTTHTDSFEF